MLLGENILTLSLYLYRKKTYSSNLLLKKTILKKKAERKTCRYFCIGYICASLCFYKTRNHIEYIIFIWKDFAK